MATKATKSHHQADVSCLNPPIIETDCLHQQAPTDRITDLTREQLTHQLRQQRIKLDQALLSCLKIMRNDLKVLVKESKTSKTTKLAQEMVASNNHQLPSIQAAQDVHQQPTDQQHQQSAGLQELGSLTPVQSIKQLVSFVELLMIFMQVNPSFTFSVLDGLAFKKEH